MKEISKKRLAKGLTRIKPTFLTQIGLNPRFQVYNCVEWEVSNASWDIIKQIRQEVRNEAYRRGLAAKVR
jgi:hypothetical protein